MVVVGGGRVGGGLGGGIEGLYYSEGLGLISVPSSTCCGSVRM